MIVGITAFWNNNVLNNDAWTKDMVPLKDEINFNFKTVFVRACSSIDRLIQILWNYFGPYIHSEYTEKIKTERGN